jgi:hypothetical protein
MKRKHLILLTAGIVSLLSPSGCVSTGLQSATNLTNVELNRGNYRIVARSVSGEARAGYILGFSFGLGISTQVFGVARVSGDKTLYKAAMDNLWKNYEARFGSAEGKKLALINQRYDFDALNLFVYTQPTVSIEADVIEFTD